MSPHKPFIFEGLQERMGKDHLSKRLSVQVDHSAKYFGKGFGRFHWENIDLLPQVVGFFLRLSGVYPKGERNAAQYEVVEVDVPLADLPEAFEGFRILQLSDIHIDGMADGGERLMGLIENLTYDLCVMTGDFRFHTFGNYGPSMDGMERLAASIRCRHGILGILGNHDFVEMVPELESFGIRMLLNETVTIERDGAAIHVVGLDDAHFYGVSELEKAMEGLHAEDVKVLLVHSPEIIAEAARAGVHYYLCGHTHGGQICLPGSIPLVTNANCARNYVSGSWRYEGMAGYTSRGTGSSGVAVRFCCRPELTVHRLSSRPSG
jgi:predicted MPP superfamily phosphohydrolase